MLKKNKMQLLHEYTIIFIIVLLVLCTAGVVFVLISKYTSGGSTATFQDLVAQRLTTDDNLIIEPTQADGSKVSLRAYDIDAGTDYLSLMEVYNGTKPGIKLPQHVEGLLGLGPANNVINVSTGVGLKYLLGTLNVNLAGITTTQLEEGSNKYYKDSLARSAVSSSNANLTYDSDDGKFGFLGGPSFDSVTIGQATVAHSGTVMTIDDDVTIDTANTVLTLGDMATPASIIFSDNFAGFPKAVFRMKTGNTNLTISQHDDSKVFGSWTNRMALADGGDMRLLTGGVLTHGELDAGDVYSNVIASHNKVTLMVANTDNNVVRIVSNAAGLSSTILQIQSGRSATTDYNYFNCYNNIDAQLDMYVDGTGIIHTTGSVDTSLADYCELFESVDGTALIRGRVVVLDSGKVRYYDDLKDTIDDIMGVVVAKKTSSMMGNTATIHWSQKYERGEYRDTVYEDIDMYEWEEEIVAKVLQDGTEERTTIHHSYFVDQIPEDINVPDDKTVLPTTRRKLNSAYDPTVEYVPRLDRLEWNAISLLGQVVVNKTETLNSRWRIMKDNSVNTNIVFIR
jgi:hypothetical protein